MFFIYAVSLNSEAFCFIYVYSNELNNKNAGVSFLVQAQRNLRGRFCATQQLKFNSFYFALLCFLIGVSPAAFPEVRTFARQANKLRRVAFSESRSSLCFATPKLFLRKPCLALFEATVMVQRSLLIEFLFFVVAKRKQAVFHSEYCGKLRCLDEIKPFVFHICHIWCNVGNEKMILLISNNFGLIKNMPCIFPCASTEESTRLFLCRFATENPKAREQRINYSTGVMSLCRWFAFCFHRSRTFAQNAKILRRGSA